MDIVWFPFDPLTAKIASISIHLKQLNNSSVINLASPKDDLRQKSIDAMVIELERASMLGIPYVVFHPGSFTTSSEVEGLDAIVNSLDQIHKATEEIDSIPLLENTAGQGSNLGWKFEHLDYIIQNVKQSDRLGVCIDSPLEQADGSSGRARRFAHRSF